MASGSETQRATAMPMLAPTPGCIALFEFLVDEIIPEEAVKEGLRVVVSEVVETVIANEEPVWLVVARLMVVYEAAE